MQPKLTVEDFWRLKLAHAEGDMQIFRIFPNAKNRFRATYSLGQLQALSLMTGNPCPQYEAWYDELTSE